MANFYVDANSGVDSAGRNGSSSQPWKTLSYAHGRISNGDTVLIRNGTYTSGVTISKSNTTWKPDSGHSPILDGGYNQSKIGTTPSKPHSSFITINGAGTTVENLTIRNIPGNGVGVHASNSTVKNCRIDHVYISAIKAIPSTSGRPNNVTLDGNLCTRSGLQAFDSGAPGDVSGNQPDPGGGIIKMGECDNSVIKNCRCFFSYGEGLNIGKADEDVVVENNEIALCAHKHIYVNRSRRVTVRGNKIWFIPWSDKDIDTGKAPGGIAIGDECGKNRPNIPGDCDNNVVYGKSGSVWIYNNLVVGMGELLSIANGKNYDTTLTKCYVGYNTFVAGPMTRTGIEIKNNQRGNPHKNNLFENNIIDWRFAPEKAGKFTTQLHTSGGEGFHFRNNCWSEKPGANYRSPGTGDQYGSPALANANKAITPTGPYPHTTSTFKVADYALTQNSTNCINRASNGSAAGGVTPPSVTTDLIGASRGSSRDIGALEYGGSVEEPELVASFTVNGGTIGVIINEGDSVAFADTSSGTPTEWEWNFGDGNIDSSSGATVSHVYASAGTWQPSLVVRDAAGRSSSATGPIVTTEAGREDDTTVAVDVVRQAIRSGTGTQNFTAALGGGPAKAAIYIQTRATDDGVDANGLFFSVGAAVNEQQQWANAIVSQNGGQGGVTKTNRHRITNGCLLSIDANGEQDGLAVHSGFVTNGHRLNVTDAFPAQRLTLAWLFGGAKVQAMAGTTMLQGASIPVRVETGFYTDLLIVSTVGGPTPAGSHNHAIMSLGFALPDGTQGFRTWMVESGRNPTIARIAPQDSRVAQFRGGTDVTTTGKNKAAVIAHDFDGSGFSFTPDNVSVNAPVNWVALRLPGVTISLSDVLTPLATDDAYLVSDDPVQFIAQILSLATLPSTELQITNPLSGVYGMYLRGASGEYSMLNTTKVNEPTSIDRSRSDDRLVIPDHAGGGPVVAGSVAFVDGLPVTTLTHTDSEQQYRQLTLMIGKGLVLDGPIANFEAVVTSVHTGEGIQFTNLSNTGGLSAAYLWDFGDGNTSTEQHPTHAWTTDGSYTITLTVTTSAGSSTETKVKYITVASADPPGRDFLFLYLPSTSGNHTPNAIYNEPHPLRGRFTVALDLDALYIDDDGDDEGAEVIFKPGKVRFGWRSVLHQIGVRGSGLLRRIIPTFRVEDMRWVEAENALYIQKPNGSWRKITTVATDPPPGAVPLMAQTEAPETGSETIIKQLTDGLHDGFEAADGTMTLTNVNSINLSTSTRTGILYYEDITIPDGHIIDLATIRVRVHNADHSSPAGLLIDVEDGSAAAPTQSNGDASGRTLTGITTAWGGVGIGKGDHYSPNFAAAVQAVLDTPGRPETFNLAIILDAVEGTDFFFRPFERGPGEGAELTIVHHAAG